MRSSKNRSRSKGNRNRNGSVGNIVNRVFDSSGPEGKVRGTPQQIVDKYNQLTRDAQLANDRVAAESFQQHAEHYTRLLAQAQREQEAKQAQHQQKQGGGDQNNNQGGGNQQGGNDQQGGNQGNNQGGGNRRNRGGNQDNQQGNQQGSQSADQKPDPAKAEQPAETQGSFDAVIDPSEGDSGLVETPESAPKPKRPRTRRRKADTPKDAPAAEAGAPRAEGKDDGGSNGGDDTPPQEAAE